MNLTNRKRLNKRKKLHWHSMEKEDKPIIKFPREYAMNEGSIDKQIQMEAQRRRTFGIISHPDAGKTTITEKLLLYSGAIRLAGSVKARKASRHAVSDWMKMEQDK